MFLVLRGPDADLLFVGTDSGAVMYSGLTLSALMPYLWMASATFATGTVPSSASAFRAATGDGG